MNKNKENILRTKSYKFAIRIVKLYRHLKETKFEYVISQQILRSGTSIGANVRESEYAESNLDFIHKLSIAQKETNETIYWLELLEATEYISQSEFISIKKDSTEILKILTSSINTIKAKIAKAQ